MSYSTWTHPQAREVGSGLVCYRQLQSADCSVLSSINCTKTLFLFFVEYSCYTMALCKTGNLRDICSQGYETPVVHQTVHKLPVHTGATRL